MRLLRRFGRPLPRLLRVHARIFYRSKSSISGDHSDGMAGQTRDKANDIEDELDSGEIAFDERHWKKIIRRRHLKNLPFRNRERNSDGSFEDHSTYEETEALPPRGARELSYWQIQALFLQSAVPFFGFGFADNFIMILIGEIIDVQICSVLKISTLFAAGVGNLISDVAGIGLGGVIEEVSTKLGLPDPNVSRKQQKTKTARFVRHAASVVGIALGCIAGMVPLLFLPDKEDECKNSKENSQPSEEVQPLRAVVKHHTDTTNIDTTPLSKSEAIGGLKALGVVAEIEDVEEAFAAIGRDEVAFEEFWEMYIKVRDTRRKP